MSASLTSVTSLPHSAPLVLVMRHLMDECLGTGLVRAWKSARGSLVRGMLWTAGPSPKEGAAGAAAAAWNTQLQGVQTVAAPNAVGDETYLFWQHLMMANLIGGVTDASVRADTAYAWGATHPAARLAGGFIVGSSNGNSGPLGNTQTGGFISGTVVALVADPRAAVTNAANVTYPITPGRAAQIDLKMDEGRGSVGFVQGFGVAATAAGGAGCFLNTPAPGTDTTYNESSNARSCGLLFRIQN